MHPDQQLVRSDRPHADDDRDRPRAADALAERFERLEPEQDLRHREPRAGRDLPLEPFRLEAEVVRSRVDGDARKERGRRIDRATVEVLAAIQARHQLDKPDRVDLVDAVRARIVAGLRRIARHREDVAHSLRMRAEKL